TPASAYLIHMYRQLSLLFSLSALVSQLPAQTPCPLHGTPVSAHILRFLAKYREKHQDVTIVLLDGSVSTDMGYASKREDAAYRPPCCTEYNIPSFIEERLRWKEQRFRRYDALSNGPDSTPVFTESQPGLTAQYDSAWDWQNKPPVSNGYNGLTRILSGPSPWKEADGFLFSAREKDELIPGSFFPGKPFGATSLRKSIYQKRLKMRCTTAHACTSITIKSLDGGRLCYWGIAWSPKEYMIQFINSARGGHDIEHLKDFEPW